jgi:hypothetical protein
VEVPPSELDEYSQEESVQADEEINAIEVEEISQTEPTIEELLTGTDELIDRSTKPAPDSQINSAFDALPWLDDMFSGEEDTQVDNSEDGDDNAMSEDDKID